MGGSTDQREQTQREQTPRAKPTFPFRQRTLLKNCGAVALSAAYR
jgi:hypothetical protein